MSKGLKIVRGPYFEVWVMSPQKASPEIVIAYGQGRSALFDNFDQAERFAQKVLDCAALENALTAVKELFEERRNDYDEVLELVYGALGAEK